MRALFLVVLFVACGKESDSEPAAQPAAKLTAPARVLICSAEYCEIYAKFDDVTCANGATYTFYDSEWKHKYAGVASQEMLGKTVQISLTKPTEYDDATITEYRLEYSCR